MITLSGFQKILVAFIIFISGMLVCRMIYAHSISYIFLWWNLFLALVPYMVSTYAMRRSVANKLKAACIVAAWLLFFPNALYILTDLIHLSFEQKTRVPVWYDAMLIFTSAIAGLLMAFSSLYKIERFLVRQTSYINTNKVVIAFLFLGSFGVYLGRFLRWNSWDVIANPIGLARQISVRFIFPLQYYHTWAITLLFTCLFSLLYFTVKKIFVSGHRANTAGYYKS